MRKGQSLFQIKFHANSKSFFTWHENKSHKNLAIFLFPATFTDTEARDASPIILREPNLNSLGICPASLYAKPLAVSHLAISFLLYARPIVNLFFYFFGSWQIARPIPA